MKKHTKIYFDAHGYPYDPTFYVSSELSNTRAIDIHHIVNREDRIENLMALNREEHLRLGEVKSKMHDLLMAHRNHLNMSGIPFNNEWFEDNLKRYREYAD